MHRITSASMSDCDERWTAAESKMEVGGRDVGVSEERAVGAVREPGPFI